MRWTWPIVLCVVGSALGGCKRDVNPSIVTLEGARYEWELFNHRLSHYEVRLQDEEVRVSVVGGTSTTGVAASLPEECVDQEDSCSELPFFDRALVRVDWARVDAPEALAELRTVELTADEDGEVTTLNLEIPGASGVPVNAWIQGFRLSTDYPLDDGSECYDPSFGWLPTELALSVGDPVVDGDTIAVEVGATFAAGNTLEEIRQCIDAVIHRARVAIEVDVVVVAGGGEAVAREITSAATWERSTVDNPVPQTPPPAADVDFGLEDPMVGWQRLAWSFHVGDPEARGAYLRTLDFQADPRKAYGTATNESGTALSGFDYTFSGTIVGKDLGGTITRGSLETTLDVALDENGAPVVSTIGNY